jgi:cardiolipin synthase
MNLANNITILRILTVPVFVGVLLYAGPDRGYLWPAALALFLFACFTDGIDGWIARRMGQMTVVGSYLDPIADKLLLLSGFLSLSFMTHLPESMRIPGWVTISVIARDIVIFIGSAVIFLTTGSLKPEPLFIGKATTVFQMATLIACLASLPTALQLVLFVMTTALTIVSGILYIRLGGTLLQETLK